MEKITLKLYEIYNLDAELNGVRLATGQVLQTGILNEKLPLVTKYWLTDLAKKTAVEKAAIDEFRNELIKKYGKPNDMTGDISIPALVEDPNSTEDNQLPMIKNPDFQAFETEFNELLQTEKEIEYKKISLKALEKVETTENYHVLFKLVDTES